MIESGNEKGSYKNERGAFPFSFYQWIIDTDTLYVSRERERERERLIEKICYSGCLVLSASPMEIKGHKKEEKRENGV